MATFKGRVLELNNSACSAPSGAHFAVFPQGVPIHISGLREGTGAVGTRVGALSGVNTLVLGEAGIID